MSRARLAYTLCAIAALALFGYCYLATAISFDTRWNTEHEPYSHGYLLLGLCCLLALRQFRGLQQTVKSPWWPAVAPLSALSMLWLFGGATHVLVLQQLALPALALGLIIAFYGLGVGSRLRFPFLLFYAAVPVWDIFNNTLQQITVQVCTWGLGLAGIPAFIEETQITIPAGTFQVAGGCSGLNYLLMIGIIAAVYAHLYYRHFWHKVLLLACAVLFGLICNWLRVFSLVIVGHASEMQSGLLGDHEILGWITFTLCLVPFLYVAMHIEALDKILPPPPAAEGEQRQPEARWFVIALVATLAAIAGPLWYAVADAKIIQSSLADTITGNQSPLIPYPRQPQWEPAYRNADEQFVLQFTGLDSAMQLHIVSYFSQEQGKELIQWGNQLVDGEQWQLTEDRPIGRRAKNAYNHARINSTITRSELVYWYAVGRYTTNSPLVAKWYQFLSFLQGRQDAALLAIYYPCPADYCTETRARAVAAIPEIKQLYRQAIEKSLVESKLRISTKETRQ